MMEERPWTRSGRRVLLVCVLAAGLAVGTAAIGPVRIDPATRLQVEVEAARAFVNDPSLDVKLTGSMELSFVDCDALRSDTASFLVGKTDARVRSYDLQHPHAPALDRPLSMPEAQAVARRFLYEHHLAITSDMRLVRQTMVDRGALQGLVTCNWQAFAGKVALPHSYHVSVSSTTGEVTGFGMVDVKVTVGTTPKLTYSHIADLARRAKGVSFRIVSTGDEGLAVLVRPDGMQRLCRRIALHGQRAPGPFVCPAEAMVLVDTDTGEIVIVATTL